jgi:hypothetical protein
LFRGVVSGVMSGVKLQPGTVTSSFRAAPHDVTSSRSNSYQREILALVPLVQPEPPFLQERLFVRWLSE